MISHPLRSFCEYEKQDVVPGIKESKDSGSCARNIHFVVLKMPGPGTGSHFQLCVQTWFIPSELFLKQMEEGIEPGCVQNGSSSVSLYVL